MLVKFKNFWQKIKTFFVGTKSKPLEHSIEAVNSSKSAKATQEVIIWVALGMVLIIMVIFLHYQSQEAQKTSKEVLEKSQIKLQVAAESLDGDKMWRNHFEDRLIDNNVKSDSKLQLIEQNINEQAVFQQVQLKTELEKVRAQVQYLIDEQAISRNELKSAKLKLEEVEVEPVKEHRFEDSNIIVNQMDRSEIFDRPKNMRNYIPETAYVKGVLLGGISVSTSIGSSSEPVPVIIRITDRGNLPKNFNIDLTHCQIMGASYGDLSSERAIVRAEILSCKDLKSELIYTTKIAGIIFGDDGMNGIKGKVVQTSGKHLRNAMIGSAISGFAQTAKGQDSFMISSAGAVDTKNKGLSDLAKDGAFNGASSAAEKIAEYYIKQAEAMSPVLVVAGGTSVDIVFTKGVYFGAVDVQDKLDHLRSEKITK